MPYCVRVILGWRWTGLLLTINEYEINFLISSFIYCVLCFCTESQDCFILDAGKSGIFAWIGKQCTQQEKLQAMTHAEKFLVDKGYPAWTKVSV